MNWSGQNAFGDLERLAKVKFRHSMLPKTISSMIHLCNIVMSLIYLKHIGHSLKLKQEKKQQKFPRGHSTCKGS